MAVYAKTVTQARDDLMEDVGWETNMQTRALRILNEALVEVAGEHNWAFLIKNDTHTMADGTGIFTLPDDFDRMLSMHARGTDEIISELTALEFEQQVENEAVSKPKFYTIKGFAQDTDVEAPRIQIQIIAAPDSGTVYQLWYIKALDALEAGSTTPNIPPFLWKLVQHRALVEVRELAKVEQRMVDSAERKYQMMLLRAKERETLNTDRRSSFVQREDVSAHYQTRML